VQEPLLPNQVLPTLVTEPFGPKTVFPTLVQVPNLFFFIAATIFVMFHSAQELVNLAFLSSVLDFATRFKDCLIIWLNIRQVASDPANCLSSWATKRAFLCSRTQEFYCWMLGHNYLAVLTPSLVPFSGPGRPHNMTASVEIKLSLEIKLTIASPLRLVNAISIIDKNIKLRTAISIQNFQLIFIVIYEFYPGIVPESSNKLGTWTIATGPLGKYVVNLQTCNFLSVFVKLFTVRTSSDKSPNS